MAFCLSKAFIVFSFFPLQNCTFFFFPTTNYVHMKKSHLSGTSKQPGLCQTQHVGHRSRTRCAVMGKAKNLGSKGVVGGTVTGPVLEQPSGRLSTSYQEDSAQAHQKTASCSASTPSNFPELLSK